MIDINREQIIKVADRVKDLRIRDEYKNRDFISFISPHDIKTNAYLFCAGICHQTHNLVNTSENLIGWHYLEHVFTKLALSQSNLLSFEYISSTNKDELINDYENLFPRSADDTRTALDNSSERIDIIIEIANHVLSQGFDNAYEFIESIGTDCDKLYFKLSEINAFSDPQRKKSTLFLKLVNQSNIIKLSNLKSLNAMMDYHMQRLLLRTGCVEVVDEVLLYNLKNNLHIESDDAVRVNCIEAIKMISQLSNISIFDLDDIFWSIGRSCCNEKLKCVDNECNKNPCTFVHIVDVNEHVKCVFDDACKGQYDKNYRQLKEPNVETCYY